MPRWRSRALGCFGCERADVWISVGCFEFDIAVGARVGVGCFEFGRGAVEAFPGHATSTSMCARWRPSMAANGPGKASTAPHPYLGSELRSRRYLVEETTSTYKNVLACLPQIQQGVLFMSPDRTSGQDTEKSPANAPFVASTKSDSRGSVRAGGAWRDRWRPWRAHPRCIGCGRHRAYRDVLAACPARRPPSSRCQRHRSFRTATCDRATNANATAYSEREP